ncbi:MAG: hypothetical protein PVJ02_03810 [Gemmatimonadota bacterium]|jgi:hypothetical protein
MRKAATLSFLLMGLAVAASPSDVVGQQAPTSPADSAKVVVVSEKSPWVAGALEYFVPTLGYGYAGNWKRGVPPNVVRLFGFGLYFADQFDVLGSAPPCEDQCVAGLALAIVGSVWAIADASAEAKRYNARQQNRTVAMSPVLSPGGWGMSMAISVR